MRLCWCSGQTLIVSSKITVAISVPSTTAKSFTCLSLLSACAFKLAVIDSHQIPIGRQKIPCIDAVCCKNPYESKRATCEMIRSAKRRFVGSSSFAISTAYSALPCV